MPEQLPRPSHSVYVIELDPAVLRDRRFRGRNAQHLAGSPCVYVGMTGLDVALRFENHRRGHKGSRYVRAYGRRLLPALFEQLNPMPYEAAKQKEVDLAQELRERGYAVWQG